MFIHLGSKPNVSFKAEFYYVSQVQEESRLSPYFISTTTLELREAGVHDTNFLLVRYDARPSFIGSIHCIFLFFSFVPYFFFNRL